MTSYSHPRRYAELDDWPYGAHRTCRALFRVESKTGRGERIARVTISPDTGAISRPKRTRYWSRWAIVTVDDTRTALAALDETSGLVALCRATMSGEAVFLDPCDDGYRELRDLILEAAHDTQAGPPDLEAAAD